MDDLLNWMSNDKLLSNDDKTKFLMIGTKQQLAKVDRIFIETVSMRCCMSVGQQNKLATAV